MCSFIVASFSVSTLPNLASHHVPVVKISIMDLMFIQWQEILAHGWERRKLVSWICEKLFHIYFLPTVPLHTLACWFFCDNRRNDKNNQHEKGRRGKKGIYLKSTLCSLSNCWNVLDGTFNKFLAYGYGVCTNGGVGTRNINWWFFKWSEWRMWRGRRVLILISAWNISARSCFFHSPSRRRWKLKSHISACCETRLARA